MRSLGSTVDLHNETINNRLDCILNACDHLRSHSGGLPIPRAEIAGRTCHTIAMGELLRSPIADAVIADAAMSPVNRALNAGLPTWSSTSEKVPQL